MIGQSNLDAALSYSARGLAVLPVVPRTKRPATPHGKDDATTDADVIRSWWAADPQRGVAVLTGEATGVVVLDIDPRNGGEESFSRLEAEHGELPVTARVRSGGGGYHYYFRAPQWAAKLLRDRANLPDFPGVDIKYGGYVVAPPTVHATGDSYEWVPDQAFGEVELAEFPTPLALLCIEPPSDRQSRSTGRGSCAARPPRQRVDGRVAEGGRNDFLFKRGSAFRGQGFDEVEIRGALQEINRLQCQPPLPRDEVAGIAASVMRYEANTDFECTDLGNARRFIGGAAGDIRFEPSSRRWYVWSGSHWSEDTDGDVMRRAKSCVDSMLADVDTITDDDVRKSHSSWARKSQSQARLSAILEVAKTEPGVPVAVEQLDPHRHLLNVENGTIDLRSGRLRPHRRDDMLTKVLPVSYAPEAACPSWDQFLDETVGEELARFLRRAVGYAATGETSEQCFFLLYGSGANGKSTFLNAVRHILGPYARQTPTETLLAKVGGGGIPSDIARLRGARFVTASEVEDGRRMAESLVKEMTGGEPITARHLYGEWFEFRPEFKLFLGTNHRPQLNGCDPAIWRRVNQVPFTRTVPPERQDRDLARKLEAEAQGILAWIVRGAVDWYEGGLRVPTAVREATDDYRREMDMIGAFLQDRCEVVEGAEVRVPDLLTAYRMWAVEDGRDAMTPNAFGRELGRRGFPDFKRGGVKYRRGLRLLPQSPLS